LELDFIIELFVLNIHYDTTRNWTYLL
jgi:hypothetical protein